MVLHFACDPHHGLRPSSELVRATAWRAAPSRPSLVRTAAVEMVVISAARSSRSKAMDNSRPASISRLQFSISSSPHIVCLA
ncbi:hypothetical protein amb1102 [Paramagnetospirillum magneticum AMB-1]|uniref:Uncharacterized protein n=1 Tax=Paramagnetospirillum magneticum (strain ATCC 700264 / AMB-1) TaxID=342108 RepID=Q2W8B9_PARM1|nr:hypothetical protein amb1102 [Paramagnetospirillum magneticum AMB-1]